MTTHSPGSRNSGWMRLYFVAPNACHQDSFWASNPVYLGGSTMKLLLPVLFLCVSLCSTSHADLPGAQKPAPDNTEEPNPFISSGVVPDVIPQAPLKVLNVTYGDTTVSLGNTIGLDVVKTQPNIKFAEGADAPYTLLMLDPDSPGRGIPIYRHWMYWMVLNVQSVESLQGGDVVYAYNGPGPPPGSGPHRYVFLLFPQNGTTIPTSSVHVGERKSFNLTEFRNNVSLPLPVAGNFFLAENVSNKSKT